MPIVHILRCLLLPPESQNLFHLQNQKHTYMLKDMFCIPTHDQYFLLLFLTDPVARAACNLNRPGDREGCLAGWACIYFYLVTKASFPEFELIVLSNPSQPEDISAKERYFQNAGQLPDRFPPVKFARFHDQRG